MTSPTPMSDTIEIKLEPMYAINANCHVCGSVENYNGEIFGTADNDMRICPDCLKAGTEEIDRRLEHLAQIWDARARWTRSLIGRLKLPD